jgi:F0F1-type ATP synthase assembly protein I
MGYYLALAQCGMEMVFPLVVGIALDYYFGWKPWGTVVGAVVGFVGGLGHLILMVNRHDSENSKAKRKAP